MYKTHDLSSTFLGVDAIQGWPDVYGRSRHSPHGDLLGVLEIAMSDQMICPACLKLLDVHTKDNVTYECTACGAELEPDAETLIELLPLDPPANPL